MTLRIRLSIIISILFFAGMVLGLSFLILSARQRVIDEVASTETLTFQLLDALLPAQTRGDDAETSLALLGELAASDEVRHLDIRLSSEAGNPQPEPVTAEDIDAPAWFVNLVSSEPTVYRLPLNTSGDMITIRSNPGDEIVEVWRETRGFMILLLVVLLILNGLLYFILGRWLTPVNTILGNLEQVEQGRFTSALSPDALPELKVIADKIGNLSRVLQKSREENEVLMRRSLQIQEEERRHLAQELHDEMGQSISAINAIAYSIAERNRDDEMSREGASRITAISNNVRGHIRSMMHRLRPVILDELGLIPALEHMVDEWNRNHANCFCSLRSSGDFRRLDDEQQIHLYRIVQEALTNVAAHSEASQVRLRLAIDDEVELQISDNGRGFDPATVTKGMGLSGMQERAKALQAGWQLETAPGSGLTMTLNFTLHQEQP